jgi:acyl-CoA reductase-like NAD-dependent aldehyde dehydrogenase
MSRIIVHESCHDEFVERAANAARSLSVGSGIEQKEVFGPVLSVMSFADDDEAIRIANSTDYGLVGGVFTKDLDRATRVARKMRSG